MKKAAYYVSIAALLAGLMVWNIAVWRECMLDHSWWYCLRAFG